MMERGFKIGMLLTYASLVATFICIAIGIIMVIVDEWELAKRTVVPVSYGCFIFIALGFILMVKNDRKGCC